jgi:hypothetical protein
MGSDPSVARQKVRTVAPHRTSGRKNVPGRRRRGRPRGLEDQVESCSDRKMARSGSRKNRRSRTGTVKRYSGDQADRCERLASHNHTTARTFQTSPTKSGSHCRHSNWNEFNRIVCRPFKPDTFNYGVQQVRTYTSAG